MLSDRERATLREIQRQFLAEDPGFVRAFGSSTQRRPSAAYRLSDQDRLAYTVLMWLDTTLSVLLLLVGSIGGAVLFAACAATFLMTLRRADATPPWT